MWHWRGESTPNATSAGEFSNKFKNINIYPCFYPRDLKGQAYEIFYLGILLFAHFFFWSYNKYPFRIFIFCVFIIGESCHPVNAYTGRSISNSNSSTKIRKFEKPKILKRGLSLIGPGESILQRKKPEVDKSRETAPLNVNRLYGKGIGTVSPRTDYRVICQKLALEPA